MQHRLHNMADMTKSMAGYLDYDFAILNLKSRITTSSSPGRVVANNTKPLSPIPPKNSYFPLAYNYRRLKPS